MPGHLVVTKPGKKPAATTTLAWETFLVAKTSRRRLVHSMEAAAVAKEGYSGVAALATVVRRLVLLAFAAVVSLAAAFVAGVPA